MSAEIIMKLNARMLLVIFVSAVIIYALARKSEVRASFKVWPVEFSLDAK
jgi:hypothetical protein